MDTDKEQSDHITFLLGAIKMKDIIIKELMDRIEVLDKKILSNKHNMNIGNMSNRNN